MTPANRHLHWAQAKVYGALMCRQLELAELTVSLVYFDVGSQTEAPPLSQLCTASELQAFFEALCERFVAWAQDELEHRERRDVALTDLRCGASDRRPVRSTRGAPAVAELVACRVGRTATVTA